MNRCRLIRHEAAMLALCDCNNFFVSCERIAHPELMDRPVVVLSANDGCVVSRSNEVKAMGIPMGEPYFRVEGLLKAKGVAVRSGNLALYKSVSGKVMRLLSRYTDAMEAYSIDEAFLNLPDAVADPVAYAADIKRMANLWLGIPISVGIAPTKTLSKLASDIAKKSDSGLMKLTGDSAGEALDATPVGDVWGIGRKGAEHLRGWGVRTAGDFVRKDAIWVKKTMSIRGVITQYELMGRPCIPLETRTARAKSIQVSRTWGSVLETYDDVERAMADNTLKAAMILRRSGLAAGAISIYIRHGYCHHGECGYFTDDARFPDPAASDFELLDTARRMLRRVYRPGYGYTQGGVTLCELRDAGFRQRSLFEGDIQERRSRLERFSKTVDDINSRMGGLVMYPASLAASDKKWRSKRQGAPYSVLFAR